MTQAREKSIGCGRRIGRTVIHPKEVEQVGVLPPSTFKRSVK